MPRLQNSARAAVLTLCCAFLGAGCSATGPVSHGEGVSAADMETVRRAAALLSGSYASLGGRAGSEVRIDAEIVRIGAATVELKLTQTGSDQRRLFGLALFPDPGRAGVAGRFAPLDADGSPRATCPLVVHVREDGWVARTESERCRFGDNEGAWELRKEIAVDSGTLVIADQVIRPRVDADANPVHTMELARIHRFTGWAGVREDANGPWRRSRPFSVSSDALGVEPEDAAGMSLGLSLELAHYRMEGGVDSGLLRLRVFDAATGALIGQSWADREALRIGLGVNTVQVGLERVAPE